MMRALASRIGVILGILLVPAVAGAQTSSIAGTVRDASGAVLPGVTVEASSPVLIEKARVGVTDGSGLYRVENLRPGIYLVTFSLAGFSTVKREGIEITSDFTATVNAELKVGTLQETITVTGESPVVDTQSITQRTVMTREVLDTIPTGRNIQAIGIMIPGTSLSLGGGGALSRDVGGSAGMQQSPLILRGSTDAVQTIEGMRLNNLEANGSYSGVYWNDGSFQELSYVTGADSAEMAQGGVRINMVPRDGGNSFRGSVFGNYTGDGWQANNLRDNLRGSLSFNPNNRITNVSMIQKIWDFNPGFGGPIARDKLWFYGTFRHWGVEKTVVDSYYDSDPATFRYVPDLGRPGIDDSHIVSRSGRVSWQASSKDRFAYYHDDQNKYRNHWGINASVTPEAAAVQVTPTSYVSVSKWTRTQTSKLLLEAGLSIYSQEYTELYQPQVTGIDDKVFDMDAIAASKVYAITEQTTNRVFNAWNAPADHYSTLRTYSGAASYVTGAHSFRLGGTMSEGPRRTVERFTGDLTMIFNAAAPACVSGAAVACPQSVTLRTPLDQREGIKADVGLFAQDRWTINRATINAGVRFDWFQGEVHDEDLPAGRWNPAAHFDGFDVQNWKDLSPRIGVAYDLFGDGKTAIKFSVARYVNGEAAGTAAQNNPETTIGRTDTRTWTDNGDFTIFNPDGSVQLNELGPSTNVNFGKLVPSTTTTDPNILKGWGVRQNNWEYTVSVQRELAPRVAVTAGYYRRSFGNQTVIDNQLTDSSSFDGPFCIPAPSSADLPNGGGYQVCGLYDLKSTSQGQVRNIRTLANNFGGIEDVFTGFDVNVNARLRTGTFVSGGINAQKRHYNTCDTPLAAAIPGITVAVAFAAGTQQADSPEKRFCDQTFPFRPDVKLVASHTLPWDFVISGTYQFTQGPNILANWAAPNSIIAPALGRNLSAGATATKTVQLIEPGTVYGEHLNQLDLRASKRFGFDRYRFRVDADLYNVFNSNWPFSLNNTFATTTTGQWMRPTNVLQGRLFKIGAQFDF